MAFLIKVMWCAAVLKEAHGVGPHMAGSTARAGLMRKDASSRTAGDTTDVAQEAVEAQVFADGTVHKLNHSTEDELIADEHYMDDDDDFKIDDEEFDDADDTNDIRLLDLPPGSFIEDNASSFLEDNASYVGTFSESLGGVYGCSGGTDWLVGPLSDRKLSDGYITASSYWHNRGDHGRGQMWRTRLDYGGTTWCAHHNRRHVWLQHDYRANKVVTKVVTKGRQNTHQWVTRYRLLYSTDYRRWHWVPGTFTGNHNRYQQKTNLISPPVLARWMRIYVEGWRSHISMRADFVGCPYRALPKGPPGAKGAKGDRGASGPRGGGGARGPPGAKGANGANGKNGVNGAKGAPGAKGAQGARGAHGAKGAKGEHGDKGDHGDKGAKGDKGDTPGKIDCKWGEWGDFAECTKSCGIGQLAGTKARMRSFKVEPQNGGANCAGEFFEMVACEEKACPTTTTTTTTTTTAKSDAARARGIVFTLVAVVFPALM